MQLKTWGQAFQVVGGTLIALGALGHSLAAGAKLAEELRTSGLSAERIANVTVVWHFAGMCMVLLGVLVAFGAWRDGLRFASVCTSLAYFGFGLAAFGWSRIPFFLVFTALGLLVLAGIWISRVEGAA